MIHLDSHAGEKEQILELLNHTINDSNLELECLINNSSDRFNPTIKHNDFISILKRYKGRPDFENKESVRLAIDFPENSKYKGVRVLVKGLGAVNSYCNNENINLIRNSVDFEMKTKPKFKNTRVTIPNYNIKFNLKLEQNFNNDDAKINELIRDWTTLPKNFRYKKTFSFIQKTKDFQIDLSIVKSSTVIDRFMTVKDVLENNWLTYVTKPADAKTSFINWWNSIKDKPTEQVMLRNASSYHKTVKESGVFTNVPKYEVEVEYIKNKEFNINKKKFNNVEERKAYLQGEFVNFFKHIGSILQCIQGSLNIISNSDKADIKKKFIKVVLDSISSSFLKKSRAKNNEKSSTDDKQQQKRKNIQVKLKSKKDSQNGGGSDDKGARGVETLVTINSDNELEYDTETEDESDTKIYGGGTNDTTDNITDDDQDNSILEGGAFHGNKGARGAEALATEFKNKLEEILNRKGIFFGPLIVDLTHNNALQIDQSAIPDAKSNTNIHINYLVTDKTDGDRNLLFFDESGNVYGIDRENGIRSFGCIMPSLANSILDGEYISRSEEDKVINNFYIFDSYIYKGENIMHKPFLFNKTEGRHNCMIDAAKYASSGNNITQSNPRLPFILYKKDYLPSDSPKTYERLRMNEGEIPLISENCSKLLNRMNVKYGGFLEVGHLYTYKTDGLVFLPNNLGVFQKSEDDYIKNPFISSRWDNNYKWKPADHLTIDFKIEYIKEMETSKLSYKYFGDKKYLLVNLLSKVWHNKPKDNNKLNFYLLNSGLKLQSIPEDFKFFATNPFIGTYDSEGEIQNNMGEAYFEVDKNDNLACVNGDLLTNGIICECAYDRKNANEQFRWKPQRIRADKTAANAYRTANAAWSLINDPITKEQLCCLKANEKYNNDENENEKGNDKEVNLETATYYTSNKNMEVLTAPLNEFASYVKRYLIERWLTGYIKPKVMDLAVGKLGDLDKYTRAEVHTLVGLDITEDGINNEKDGAATRMMNVSANNPAVAKLAEKTILLVGTAVKNIANGDCVRDNINKYYLDVLYGRAKGNTPKLKKMAGVALDGFDMITCMYAIHYMMNNENDLDSFLQNVSENLLDQGYFIGTCLDGMTILKEMGRRNEIKGEIDDKTVFFIRKNDVEESYKDITVNNKITVFYEKFAGYFPENLVNISYLKEKAKGHNLKLIEFRTFLEEPGNILSQYGASNMKNERLIKQSEAMMTWAKFNCYFVFQKIRGKE